MDALRRANVAAHEPGGITQSLTAFQGTRPVALAPSIPLSSLSHCVSLVQLRDAPEHDAALRGAASDPAQRWRSSMTLLCVVPLAFSRARSLTRSLTRAWTGTRRDTRPSS